MTPNVYYVQRLAELHRLRSYDAEPLRLGYARRPLIFRGLCLHIGADTLA